jgi:hypothetical protein
MQILGETALSSFTIRERASAHFRHARRERLHQSLSTGHGRPGACSGRRQIRSWSQISGRIGKSKLFINAATGTVEVRKEGVAVLTVGPLRTATDIVGSVGVDPKRRAIQSRRLRTTDGERALAYKDFCIWDGSGARNNNFLGSRVVKRLKPNGDVVFPWTPSTGVTGYNRINALAPT